MIKYFHDYPTMKESSAFMFHSNMKGLRDSSIGNSVLHVVSSQWRKIESHGVPGLGIEVGWTGKDNDDREVGG